MNNNDRTVMIIAMILAAVVTFTPAACQINRDTIRTKAIADSSDPIATSCALDSTDHNGNSKAICTLKASK